MDNTKGHGVYGAYTESEFEALMREVDASENNEFAQQPAMGCVPPAGQQTFTVPQEFPAQQSGTYPQQMINQQAAVINTAHSTMTPQQVYAQRAAIKLTDGYAFSFGDEEAQAAAPTVAAQREASAADAAKKQAKQTQPKEKREVPPPSIGKRIRDTIILFGMTLIFTVSAMVMLPSGIKKVETVSDQKSFFEDLEVQLLSFKSDAVSTIFEIPKIYTIPWGEQPAPEPNPDNYGSTVTEDGTEVLTYEDETISVRYWMERDYYSNVHFAEVKIAHPTQLRTAFAGGEYSDSVKYMPMDIADGVNAVIAMNADFYNYRKNGVIIRQNTVYRNTPTGWDVLLIDSEGDFHIMNDRDVASSGVLEEYEIVNTLEFGPSLIIDGKINVINLNSGCGPTWNEKYHSPRAAIGQLGKLHYLFCVVEGRSDESRGVLTSQMAEIMLKKGCVMAYNLDGGQSATLMLDGVPLNAPLWGNQREVSDIIYCATAIPNEEANANER